MGMYCELHTFPLAAAEQLGEPGRLESVLGFGREAGGGSQTEPPARSLDLQKSWHGLNYLLTGGIGGDPLPLGFLINGEPIGEDLGYGPALLHAPGTVLEIHSALSSVSDEDFWSRFDPAAMERDGIYPGIWDEPDKEQREGELGYCRELKEFIASASAHDQAVLVVIT